MPEWNGSFGRETILGLLSLVSLAPFEGWRSSCGRGTFAFTDLCRVVL
jgi:hypothetical protein